MAENTYKEHTYRVILEELILVLDAYKGYKPTVSNQGQAMDGFSALANFVSIAEKAKSIYKI